MSRPLTWYPLASSDPVPGDPVVVRAGGDHYRRVAEAIGDAEKVLRTLVGAQEAVSEAVDAIRDRTVAVADRIRQAYQRYDAAGDALVGYSIQLDLAQHESLDALHTAQTAQRTVDDANSTIRRLTLQIDDAEGQGEDVTASRRALATTRVQRADAEVAVARARLLLEQAVARRDEAARRALETLDDGLDDKLNDTWWEDWGAETAQVVSTWAGGIATTAGLLSLVLGWVPGLGPALAAVSVIAGAIALVADIALAVKRGDGDDWFNVTMGALGILSFGASRLLTGSLKAFQASTTAARAQIAQQVPTTALARLWYRLTPGDVVGRGLAGAESALTRGASRQSIALQQIRELRGWDRALALAGHGDVVRLNNQVRADLLAAFPFRPAAFMALIGPAFRGAAVEAAASVKYVGDVALTFTSVTKFAVDQLAPSPATSEERLHL